MPATKTETRTPALSTTRNLHYVSGLLITAFVGLHLFNHAWAVFGEQAHLDLMNTLRLAYRNIAVEAVLLVAVLVQIVSGLRLFLATRKQAVTGFDRLHVWTGLYLAGFFLIHVGAVLSGRFLLGLDTNFYFGVAGLNTFPLNLFFVPYYALAILAFFGHIAAVHQTKMTKTVCGLTPGRQSWLILAVGFLVTAVIFYGLTNGFRGVSIPEAYQVLVGK